MAELPLFPFTTQEDWYGELKFLSADAGNTPLPLAGRTFEMPITPSVSGASLVSPVKTLTMAQGGGLSLKVGDPSVLVFRVPKSVANDFARQEYTADVLEVVDGERHLFMPVRVRYSEPSGILSFISRFVGVAVSFSARLQPIITPVAIAGRQGAAGATIINGTAPPVPGDGKDGDFLIEDRTASNQGRRMYGPKVGGAWPPTPWTIEVLLATAAQADAGTSGGVVLTPTTGASKSLANVDPQTGRSALKLGAAALLGKATTAQAQAGLDDDNSVTSAKSNDLLKALLGSTSVKATGVATVQSVADWLRDVASLRNTMLDVADARFGASASKAAALNTAAIQTAIDFQFARGGGPVLITDWFPVARTVATDSAYAIVTGQGGEHVGQITPGPLQTALILRKGVTLIGRGKKTSGLEVSGNNAAASIIDGDGQSICGLGLRGWDPTGKTGSAAGINLFVSADGNENRDLVFDDLEISGFGGYGIGAQYGNMINNRYSRLHIHHVGADAIDHKARCTAADPYIRSSGITFSDLLLEFYGQRSGIVGSSGLDLRGFATMSQIHCRKFAVAGAGNVGLRLNAGLATGVEYRQPGSYSTLTGFLIEGDPLIPTVGVNILSANGIKVSNGNVLNCTTAGVRVQDASSAYGSAFSATIMGVTVEGSRSGNAFETYSPDTLLIGCTSRGACDFFEAKRANLVDGQTVFTAPRGYDPATVYVQRNGVTEAGVTATNGTTFTLSTPAVATDIISVITPNAVGVYAGAAGCRTVACAFEFTTVPETGNSAGTPSYSGNSNKYPSTAAYRTVYPGGVLAHQVFAADPSVVNADYRIEALGTGGFEARSQGTRALRAASPAGAVNWLQISSSASGAPVALSFQGSDANGDVQITPKGTGLLRFGVYTSGAPTATGYLSVKAANGTVYKLLAAT